MARLQDKVEAVLRQRPIPLRQNAHQTGFRTVREKQNNTPASASHQGPSQQASKWCKRTPGTAYLYVATAMSANQLDSTKSCSYHVAGQYPAIDRVLARKQAISKLHRLRDTIIPLRPQIEEGLEANVATQTPGSTAALDLNFPQSQQLVFVHYSTCDVPSPMHSLSGTAQPAPAHLDASHSADASHFAHEQYLCFKAWRQERSNAAVIIQKHARGLLARRLCVQTRCLVSHKKLTQRRTLSSCIQWWRCFACTSSRFR